MGTRKRHRVMLVRIERPRTYPTGFYVYGIKLEGTLRYIGCGTKGRGWDMHSRYSSIQTMVRWGATVRVEIFVEGLTQREDAEREETRLIKLHRNTVWNKQASPTEIIRTSDKEERKIVDQFIAAVRKERVDCVHYSAQRLPIIKTGHKPRREKTRVRHVLEREAMARNF